MRPSICLAEHKRGFTLVEMAVVLTIIGLLVGGITGLSNYSRNAKLKTVINEGKVLMSAFGQFQTRYGAPPGDFSTASASWSAAAGRNGDGNGLIRAGSSALPLERYYAFQHLALAGFIQGTYTGAVNGNGGATIGLNVVGAAMDKVAFMFDHPAETDGFVVNDSGGSDALYFRGQYGNILRIAKVNDNSATIPQTAYLSGEQALQIDTKFDDGLPGQGNIVTPIGGALANCASNNVWNTAVYVSAANGETCYLFLKMP